VRVSATPKLLKSYPHGSTVTRQDSSLSPGEHKQTAWAHDGADVVIQRTVKRPHQKAATDQLTTHYQPWRAVVLIGPAATPTPVPKKTRTPSPTPATATTATATPGATPTATANH
jgi:hypothetical protein